ncbi:hypothetical protein, partial [Bacillus thuringiensis]|uniref:hypothetical protein n=1 Tax=Bacillus thuringiensis TaxID=1428 RepID=UPI001C92E432
GLERLGGRNKSNRRCKKGSCGIEVWGIGFASNIKNMYGIIGGIRDSVLERCGGGSKIWIWIWMSLEWLGV